MNCKLIYCYFLKNLIKFLKYIFPVFFQICNEISLKSDGHSYQKLCNLGYCTVVFYCTELYTLFSFKIVVKLWPWK